MIVLQLRRISGILVRKNTGNKWILFVSFLLLATVTLNAQSHYSNKKEQYEITGTVLGSGKEKLEFATVSIPAYAVATATDENGRFVLKFVPPGAVRLRVNYVGNLDIDTLINVNKDLSLSLVMKKENFKLKEVLVVAAFSQAGQSTSSTISRNAIDHLQATSLGDLLSLLPGGWTSNQRLSYTKQARIRNVASDANDMNAFGVSIIKDGSPLSNNANLQTMHPAVVGGVSSLSGGTPPAGGVDLRLLSTDNIESVEVIRGIPSVQYGDLSSGAVIVNSKAGRTPLRVTAKANPNVYEFSAHSGFSLGEKKGTMNVTGDYAHNVSDPVQSYITYRRSNLHFLYSNWFFKRLSNHTSVDFMYGADRREKNPDDEITKTESKGDNVGLRFNTHGMLKVDKPWLSVVRYAASVSYTAKKSYLSQQYTAANSPYSMTTSDGAVLSNKPGAEVFDKDGNRITRLFSGEESLYALETPSTYVGRYDIDGKEINVFVNIAGNLYKRLGNTHHSLLAGVDFKTDGNKGRGKTFDKTAPPYRNLSAVNASFRPRAYKDIPFVNQFGLYVQDDFRFAMADRTLNVTGGIRYDKISVVKAVFSPRVNVSFEVWPKTLFLRGGYGVAAKAPSSLFLYPEQAYFEYVNINELSNETIPEEDRLLITTTRVFDTHNRNLKIARNKKAEIGFDLKIGQASLFVTAFRERLKNGYTMALTPQSFQPVVYDQYARTAEGLVLSESHPVLAQYYMPTNDLRLRTEGVEVGLNAGRFHSIRTSFSVDGMWIRSQSYSDGYTFFDAYSGVSGSSRTHIGVYEKGMAKDNRQRFTTTLRATHNIPEIGFVVTLTGQRIWQDWQWYDWGNDRTPILYLSKTDGRLHSDFSGLTDDDYKLLLRTVNDKLYIREKYAPALTFNVNVTKELGDYLRVSFFANNMFRNYPSVRSKRTPSSYLTRTQSIFFGLEVSLTL